jgi:cellulose synthase/poly-beta-1,6-N-acetylglucosamine synthase-like glycosyltransferase
MEQIFYIIIGLYALMHFIMLIGVLRNKKIPPQSSYEPVVSVVISAKDEESCIEDCIRSLLEMDYPRDKLEIVLVNDRSVDRTKEIMTTYSSTNPHIKYVEITEERGKLKGKANALAQALKTAAGEIIFTTDADIKVNRKWIREFLNYYREDTGVAAGYSVIEPKNLFRGLQSIDWLYLLTVAAGGDGIGLPISCVGNNMSYRKKAYDEIGGYENIPFSITEDFMLLQKIHKNGGYKTCFPVNKNTVNITLPCLTLKQLVRQKKRWSKGGLGELNPGMAVGLFSFLTGIVLLFSWLFVSWQSYIVLVLAKTITDLIFLYPAIKEFKLGRSVLYLIFFEYYFAVYVVVLPFLLAFDWKVVWKDQKI